MDVNQISFIVDTLQSSESSDSSSDGGFAVLLASSSSDSSCTSDEEHAKVKHFMETIEQYSELDFKSYFRIYRSTAKYLIEKYRESEYTTIRKSGREQVGPQREMYIFLWYMANTEPFRVLSNLFGITKSTAWNVVVRVSSWLITIGSQYISWPEGSACSRISAEFERKSGVPGIIGAIDSSHIRIKAPKENKEAYFNRKHYYSVYLQAVVDAKLMFTDVSIGEPGSMHDSRVLRRSLLYQRAFDNRQSIFPKNTFLIGDSAYPISDWIVPPFRDNGSLTRSQKKFNSLISSSRIVVENAFGLMKTRFRRLLHFTEQSELNFVINLIMCGCILHNICIIQDDLIEYSPEEDNIEPSNQIEESNTNSMNRRDILFEYLVLNNIVQ